MRHRYDVQTCCCGTRRSNCRVHAVQLSKIHAVTAIGNTNAACDMQGSMILHRHCAPKHFTTRRNLVLVKSDQTELHEVMGQL